jgi:regulator of sirC expression with transglutaminase-like and TPR domain
VNSAYHVVVRASSQSSQARVEGSVTGASSATATGKSTGAERLCIVERMNEARVRFAAIVAPSVARIPLAEAALWIAGEEYPELDVDAYLDRLDELAEAARDRLSAKDRIARFNDFLFRELGFSGNAESYDDPRNSFLNEVLDRRCGIPITLSLVYTEVAGRLGLPVVGVGFPGHFLVKWTLEPEVIVDPFFGKILSRPECEEKLRSSFGAEARLAPDMLAPATAREILVRMLRNLKHNYLGRGDLERALGAVDRILLVSPDEADELRDRGMLYFRQECFAAALRDFERYLMLAPNDPMAAEIRARLPDLRREAARLQ